MGFQIGKLWKNQALARFWGERGHEKKNTSSKGIVTSRAIRRAARSEHTNSLRGEQKKEIGFPRGSGCQSAPSTGEKTGNQEPSQST